MSANISRIIDQLETFRTRVTARQTKIGVVRMGYVGLPLTLLFSEERFVVTGFDIDREKVEALSSSRS
jgi:UDP-N-acetyl-D-glucosamine dehydrogenase